MQTALYTLGSFFMNTRVDHDPIEMYLQKNVSVSLLKNVGTTRAGESLKSLLNEISKMANLGTTLENGDRKKYNDVILAMLGNAVHQINGDTNYIETETQLPLPDLSKCKDCSKDAPCKNYSLLSVYLDLSESVFPAKMDTNQKQKLEDYRKTLLECKTHYERFQALPAVETP